MSPRRPNPKPIPCDRCDTQGPLEPTLISDSIELHRAVHDVWRAIVPELPKFIALVAVVTLAVAVVGWLRL